MRLGWLFVTMVLVACSGCASSLAPSAPLVSSAPVGIHTAPTGTATIRAMPTPSPSLSVTSPGGSTALATIKTVFIIMMENHNWSQIHGSPSAPYINNELLPKASHAEQYYNPPGIHPSEPNYLWLEAGTNFGISDDADPLQNHQATTAHLVTLLGHAGIPWKAYQEGITGQDCPLTERGLYAPKHNPMVYFDDTTDTNKQDSTSCISHVRPYSELNHDLQQNSVARYNFITPDLCDDMHDSAGCQSPDSVKNGDTWLAGAVPAILHSEAYRHGGAIFITWDEGEGSDGPVGLIVLAGAAEGAGYSNIIHYTHSSLLRTIQEIFGVRPWLGDAAKAVDLGDLFRR